MINTTIPAELLARYPEIAKGMAILAHKREEARFNGLVRNSPKPYKFPGVNLSLRESDPQPEIEQEPTTIDGEDWIRVNPLILTAAISTKQDIAARLWFIARHIDCGGSGWIYKSKLQDFLQSHNVGERQRRRWITAALAAGLLAEDKNYQLYRITGLRAGSKILGASLKGYPVLIPTHLLLKRVWHAYAWNGYLATRGNTPISQVKLAELTGISARTQKKYQKIAPINKKRNYVQTDLDQSHLIGTRENGRPSAFVGYKHKIYFRLPDDFTVPESMAKRPTKRPRVKVDNNRKMSSRFSATNGREKLDLIRLFHKSEKSANTAVRKIANIDLYPWNKPREVFFKQSARQTHNVWTMLSTETH